MAADTPSASSWPPFNFRLVDASVRVQLLPAHGLPRQTLSLAGTGQGSFERDGRTLPFTVTSQEFLGTVNALYHLRFFDLADQLRSVRSVFLKDDGSVGTQAASLHDTLTTKVCFNLPQFTKCVSYEADPPLQLERLVQGLLTQARQRTMPSEPSGNAAPAAPAK